MSDENSRALGVARRLRPSEQWLTEHASEIEQDIEAQIDQFARQRFESPTWSLQQLACWVAFRSVDKLFEFGPKTPRPRAPWYHGEIAHPLLVAFKEITTALQLNRLRCLNRPNDDWFELGNDLWQLHKAGVELFLSRQEALELWPQAPQTTKRDILPSVVLTKEGMIVFSALLRKLGKSEAEFHPTDNKLRDDEVVALVIGELRDVGRSPKSDGACKKNILRTQNDLDLFYAMKKVGIFERTGGVADDGEVTLTETEINEIWNAIHEVNPNRSAKRAANDFNKDTIREDAPRLLKKAIPSRNGRGGGRRNERGVVPV